MCKITSYIALFACGVLLAATGCGDLERDNSLDPRVTGGGTLEALLIGSWSRDDGEKNELYVFRADGRFRLHDYISPSGGAVDRKATFPQTRERIFEGDYKLVIDQLTISFTDASSNDPSDPIMAPSRNKVVRIRISGSTLTLKETDGPRLYARQP